MLTAPAMIWPENMMAEPMKRTVRRPILSTAKRPGKVPMTLMPDRISCVWYESLMPEAAKNCKSRKDSVSVSFPGKPFGQRFLAIQDLYEDADKHRSTLYVPCCRRRRKNLLKENVKNVRDRQDENARTSEAASKGMTHLRSTAGPSG